jgi:predicted TIM-barrel fold metal-dependent hydrolase
MMELSEFPVIDSHCHGFLPEEGTGPFEQYLKLSSKPIPREDMVNTFIYRQVVRELSRVLDCRGSHDKIIDERNKLYRQDPFSYIKLLFGDARIETLLVDTGYPFKEFAGYSINQSTFSKIVPCKVLEIFRIDNVVYNLVKDRVAFDSSIKQFHAQINEAVKSGAVSLKTVIAYTAGLEIQRNSRDDARKAHDALVAQVKSGRTLRKIFYTGSHHVKTLMDFFVFLGLEYSVDLSVPFQLHVGMGNHSIIDIRRENPLLLRDLINDESSKDAKIILTHGGYPYIEEAGFLANSNPNVFLDISAMSPFISIGLADKLINLFEMTPVTKIMYGSDGHRIPELFWFSALQTKRALSSALNELVESEEIEEDWALEIARKILSENAKKIYHI